MTKDYLLFYFLIYVGTYYNAMLVDLGVLRQLNVSLRRTNRAFVFLNSEQGKSREDAVQRMMRGTVYILCWI